MKNFYYILIAIVLFILIYLINIIGQIKITADFEELEPFKHSLPVYYKGFKLGHTVKVYPGPDYQTTRVDMKIKMKGLKLPENTGAVVKRKDSKDYIELVYPKTPYINNLRNHSLIHGTKGVNFENFIQEQIKNGGIDEIKDNLNGTIISAGKTLDALTEMLNVTTGIIEDSRPSIEGTLKNINIASKNIADSSSKINSSLEKESLNNTINNLEQTTKNISDITGNINNNSMNLVNCLVKNINTVVCNINQIIVGVGDTLKKKFGGLRLIFGKTLS